MFRERRRQLRARFRRWRFPATTLSSPGRTRRNPQGCIRRWLAARCGTVGSVYDRPFPWSRRTGVHSVPLQPMRILIVEDEIKVANALKEGFEQERYDAVVAHTGEVAFFRI